MHKRDDLSTVPDRFYKRGQHNEGTLRGSDLKGEENTPLTPNVVSGQTGTQLSETLMVTTDNK